VKTVCSSVNVAGAVALLSAAFPVLAQTAAIDSVKPEAKVSVPAKPTCDEVDEEEIDKIDTQKSFFNNLDFECEQMWLDAEQGFASKLQKLGEESFRPYSDPLIRRDDAAPIIRIRKMSLYDHGDHKLLRLDCDFIRAKEKNAYPDWESKGGRFLVDYHNRYVKPTVVRRELRLGAADCRYIAELLEEVDFSEIEQLQPADPEGPIILHAGTSWTEAIEQDGSYKAFERYGGLTYFSSKKSYAAEEKLWRLLNYLEERTTETGKRCAKMS
jgi:hypothetical protein